MHHNPTHPRISLAAFLRARPWIWIVLGYVTFMALTISFVVIAVKNKEPEVPLHVTRP
jgi:hypothetical protein